MALSKQKPKQKLKQKFKQKTFAQGVYPAEMKSETDHLPIQQFPFAPVMVIPLVLLKKARKFYVVK